MQCTKAAYNAEIQYSRIDEVRLGIFSLILGGGTGRDIGLPSSSAPSIRGTKRDSSPMASSPSSMASSRSPSRSPIGPAQGLEPLPHGLEPQTEPQTPLVVTRLRAELQQAGVDAKACAEDIEREEHQERRARAEHTAAEVAQQERQTLRAENQELQASLGAAGRAATTTAEALERFRTEHAETAGELTRLRAEQEVMMTKAEEITRLRAEQEVMAREHERLRAEYATVQQVRMIETHQLTEAIRYMRFLSYLTPHLCNLLDHCIQLFFSRCDLTVISM